MKVKRLSNEQNGELIILLQSTLLLAFGLAAWGASDTIIGCLNVLRDSNNMVAFATEDAIITESGTISTTQAQTVINNFELICLSAMSIGIAVSAASLVRLVKKRRSHHG